jgi:inositol-pentakisphosphate 2-kinase
MELEIRLDAAAWKYLGEGNQNIVLQYAGRDARLCGRVLRLRKTTQDTQSADDAVRTCFEFLRNEMGPLLGDDVVNVGTLVQLPAGFAAAVSDAIRASRPASRTAKSLDARCTLGWLLPDLTLLESVVPSVQRVYVVEVKPKCGFVPSSRYA